MKNIICAVFCALLSINVFAQTTPDTTKNVDLNEVEINAVSNKAILYQPFSIAKIGVSEIKRGQGLFLDDAINANIPGVSMYRRTVSANQQFNIRGYGNGVRGTNGVTSNFDGQGYKVYLNGIPITDAEGITLMDDIDFGSVGSVEVIKGPAGTQYGLAISGVVNLKTVAPEKGQSSISQEAMIGDYGLQRYTTSLKVGAENASFLINYGRQQCDGFMVHTNSTKDFVNFIAQFRASDKQSINTYVGYSNSYDQRGGELSAGQYDTLNYSGNPAYIKNNAHSNIVSFRAGVGQTYKFTENFSNTTSVFGSGVTNNVSSAGGWTDKNPINYGARTSFDLNFNLKNGLKLSGSIGGEAQRQNATIVGYSMVADSTNLTGYNVLGPITSDKYVISATYSLFTEWTLALPNDLSITAGIGTAYMGIDLTDRFYVAANNKPSNKVPLNYSVSYDGMVSPHLVINKVFNKQFSVYASYSKGYKAPTSALIFIPTINSINTTLRPEIGNQFEIGTKGNLLDNTLEYQLAIFDAIFSDKMTTLGVPTSTGAATAYTYVANGGKQDDQGIEFLLKYTAYKSTDGFFTIVRPFVNVAYSNFKYVDFKYQTLSADKKSISEVDFSGNKAVNVPPLVFNAGVDVGTSVGLYANANYNYRDGVPFTSDGANVTKSYALLNAKLGFKRTVADHFTFDAYFGANNITGVQYYYMVFANQLPDVYLPAPTKINYYGGVNVSYKF